MEDKTMNDKEFNLQILAALTDYANELIAAGRVTVAEPGRYTAYNIDRRRNDMGEPLHVDMTDGREPRQITVGNFTCTVAPCNVFGIICSFEKLAGVKGKEKTRFAFGDTTQDNIVKGKAMFADASGQTVTRTKNLRRVSERIATDKEDNRYFQVRPGGMWYYIADKHVPVSYIMRDLTPALLGKCIEDMRLNCPENRLLPIYEALLTEWEAATAKDCPEEAEETAAEPKTEEAEKPKRAQGARFAFSMCGIQPGEKVVFTPEQIEVTVADDTHVEFCGELFSLSGFCRAFMPDGKRKPSNAYQGPKYFTYKGVALAKLRAEKAVCVEVETQEVRAEEKNVATPSDLAQERTEAHSLTTYHAERDNGLKRMFVKQTNTLVMRIFNGFPTENQRINTKCRKFSTQMVVHTLPLPPPKPQPYHGHITK